MGQIQIMKNKIMCIKFIYFLISFTLIGLISCRAEHDQLENNGAQNEPGTIIENPTPVYAQLKGYALLNTNLRNRLFLSDNKFFIGYPIQEEFFFAGQSLLGLMGEYVFLDGHNRFKNGVANEVNMLLTNLIFNRISLDIADKCKLSQLPPQPQQPTEPANPLPDFNIRFTSTLTALCDWPLEPTTANTTLTNYWFTVMSYDAPEDEYLAWQNFANSPEMRLKSRDEAVWALNLAIFLSPYYLINYE